MSNTATNSQKANFTPKAKYRPPFTASQITFLLALAKADYITSSSAVSLECLQILSSYQNKIDSKLLASAYETKGRESLLDSLGGGDSSAAHMAQLPDSATLHATQGMAKEAYWKLCYERYAEDPTLLSVSEIQAAKEHMYLNDLMSAEEIAQHEKI